MASGVIGCTRVLHTMNAVAPVVALRTSEEPSTSSISRLHFQGGQARKLINMHIVGNQNQRNQRVSITKGKTVLIVRASGDENVRELASDKAVDEGKTLYDDAKKLAANGNTNVSSLEAKAEDASDDAAYGGEFREKAVDVASNTAVDSWPQVDELAKKDAAGIADQLGRTVEETAESLEIKAKQLTDREVQKESEEGSSSSGPEPFFKDQVMQEKALDVASESAVDEGEEVKKTAGEDASDMTNKVGGDLRRNEKTISELASTASKLEADRSGSEVDTGATKSQGESKNEDGRKGPMLEDLKRTVSKNLKEGIDSSRPGIEELSRNVAKGVKVGRENLEYGAEGAVETGAIAREGLDVAREALDKRMRSFNLAAEDARETGSLVAELAAKGWDALSKTTERFVDNFQKNVGAAQANIEEKVGEVKKSTDEFQEVAKQKAEEARQKAGETAEQAQSKFNEARGTVESKTEELKETAQEKAEQAQDKFNDARGTVESKTGELKEAAQEKGEQAQDKFNEARGTVESKAGELKETAQEKGEQAQDKFNDARGTVESKTGEFKQAAQEKGEQAQDKFNESRGTVESKTGELKETAQEKAEQSKSKLEETADEAQSKFGDVSSSTKQNLGQAQEKAEETASDVKKNLQQSSTEKKDSFENAVDKMAQNYEQETGNEQLAATGSSMKSQESKPLKAETDFVPAEKDNEWTGKAN